MSVSVMKFIDEYFGRIAVFFISFFKSFWSRKKVFKEGKRNLLFIKFWGLGSIILTSPAVKKVRAAYPDSKLYFLTLKNNFEICRETGTQEEVITIDISGPGVFISDLINKTRKLRKTGFDVVYDFEFYTYFSAIIVSLLKPGISFGFDNLKNNRKILFTDTVLFNENVHTKENFLHLVNADERVSSVTSSVPELPVLKSITDLSNGVLKIAVNVNASRLAYERRLPADYFIEIINFITKKYRCKVMLIGSADETEYVKNIYDRLEENELAEDLSGKTTVKELIAMINSSACLITNDSGPLHVASALNIPVIAFFGPETPVRYGPLSNERLVFYKDLDCSPCMSISNSKTVNCIYDSPRCMEQFEMKEVIGEIELFINDLTGTKNLNGNIQGFKDYNNKKSSAWSKST